MKSERPPKPVMIRLGTAHLEEAQDLSAREHWPHRREDWQFMLDLGSGFGLLAGGRLVGTALLVPHGARAATCGMIIVDARMRGHGLGRRLMAALLAKAGARECRLIATDSGQAMYARMGFVPTAEVLQCQGIAAALPAPGGVVPATAADLRGMAALDRAATGMDRGLLLRRLIAAGPVLLLRDATGLRGHVACRRFGRGALIGPLVARDPAAAEILMRAAISRHAGGFLRVDLTVEGSRLAALVHAAGLAPVGGGRAMTRPGARPCPAPSGAAVHALASQALC